ncbi:helical backbone metal receptor [Maribellus sp. YY47]|uniref:ABC transporter substrate-binding protein n=1 Tax=Maribellus sp. YY47 TaxID=2929486 RepID=UPI002000EE0D|nr:helical backbone metal receptor [Maribellus sp. YY47]MCK3684326.1 helical backbone metal receptor [Maribellus sp. YY47]
MNAKSIWLSVVLFLLIVPVFGTGVQRVVSLAPSITENIYLIGAQNKLVGCTSYCTQAVNDGVDQVGSTIDVNIEKLFSLKPDLVLALQLTKQQDIAAMEKLGIRVETMKSPRNFAEMCEQTKFIADLLGSSEHATEVLEPLEKRVAEIQQLTKSLKPQKIFFQIGANPIFTVLENTFMNDFITFCNGSNIGAGLTKGTMTRESVVLRNPDVIIIATMGGFGETEKEEWMNYKSVSAVQNGKVFLINSETSCSPTPQNFVSALEDMYRFLSE